MELADVGRVEEMGDGGRVGESLRDGDVEVAAETVVVEVCPVGGEDLVGEDADGDWTEVSSRLMKGPDVTQPPPVPWGKW